MFARYLVQWLCQSVSDLETFYTLLVFVGVLLITKTVQYVRFLQTLPPGPWGLPIIGYLPFLKGDVHLLYGKLAQKYGPVFSARLGTQLVVIVSDYKLIRDTFRREEFTGRPHTEFIKILGGYGIINTEGDMWKEQRKFLHEKLRFFGMTGSSAGKKVMEARIMREVDTFIQGLLQNRGEPTDLSGSLGMSISNVICSIIMGVRFQRGDNMFNRFMGLIEEGFRLFGSVNTVNFVPIMRYLPCLQVVRDKIAENRDEMAEFFQRTVNEHRETFNPEVIRDLCDTYLHEIQKAKVEGREHQLFQGKDHDRQIQQIMGDLFSGGMETVKTTLEWAVVLMLHYPEAAKAVQEELDQVVGRGRMPGLEDMNYLPITEATICEILRRSSIVPLGTTHATTKDVVINGYTVPAGTQIVPLLHAVHMDQDSWDGPEDFRPARFLSPEGKVKKPEFFMPFGVGRRMCLGELLARYEIFLFFTCLLHSFDLKLPEDEALPSLRGNAGITVTPDRFKVCLIQRQLDLTDHLQGSDRTNGPLRNLGSH